MSGPTSDSGHDGPGATARQHLDTGIAAAGRGDWTAAADAFRRAVADSPDWPDGHHNLSIALASLNDLAGAIGEAQKAVALDGSAGALWLNLGNLTARANDLNTAEHAFRTALRIDGNTAAAHLNLGLVLCSRHRWPDAIPHLEAAHLASGGDKETGLLLASALRLADRGSDALEVIGALPAGAQSEPAVIFERAQCLTADGDTAGALSAVNALLDREPTHSGGIKMKTRLLAQTEAWAEHDAFLTEAHAHMPGNLDVASALAARLLERNDVSHALDVARTVIAEDAENCDALVLLGTCHWENNAFDEASASYEAALARDPRHLGALQSIASLYFELNQFARALSFAQQGLEVDPSNARLLNTLSLAHLALGQLAEGWDAGEHPETMRRRMPRSWLDPAKDWHGKDLSGQTVRIRPEQGIGDEIRFSTCFPDVIADASRCIVDCDPRLLPIFQRTYPDAEFHPLDPSAREDNAAPAYAFDLEALAGSLPRRYRRSLQSFPNPAPTLRTNPDLDEKWRKRLDAMGPDFKIGLCWRSTIIDRQRMRRFFYTHTDDWEDLYRLDGVSFVNLFPNATDHELEIAKTRFGVTLHQWNDLDLKDDVDDILSLINALDLVITVQAAVWTFAGALGKDALVLLNPNVLMGNDRVPWFPSIEPVTTMWTRPWPEVSADIADRVSARIARKRESAGLKASQ